MTVRPTLSCAFAVALARLARGPSVQRQLNTPWTLQQQSIRNRSISNISNISSRGRSAMILNTLRKKSTDAKAGASVHPVTASASTAAADPQQARMLIGFTCKVCSHRQHKTMSKQAYTKGVVLIQCDKCKNRHLIADHLGWFRDTSVTIQDIMREKGESIRQLEDIGLLDNIEAEKVQQALDKETDQDKKHGN